MKISWHNSLGKVTLTAGAHIDCTHLTSSLPQLHRDKVYIYPPQVKNYLHYVGRTRDREGALTQDMVRILVGRKLGIYRYCGRNIHILYNSTFCWFQHIHTCVHICEKLIILLKILQSTLFLGLDTSLLWYCYGERSIVE